MCANKMFLLLVIVMSATFLQGNHRRHARAITAGGGANGHRSSIPDITNPGPDTPSFPTSPFTLKKGRSYFENFPLYVSSHNDQVPASYNWPFLLRVGLTDFLEFRLASLGFTVISASDSNARLSGLSPLSFGFKLHLWGSQDMLLVPSAGIEAFVVTPIASKELRDGTQFIINALFKHTFAQEWNLEWNVGVFSTSMNMHQKRAFFALVTWALQKRVIPKLALFFEGSYTSPNHPSQDSKLLLGVGFQSPLTQRIALYGSYIWSVFKSDHDSLNIGFAVAF